LDLGGSGSPHGLDFLIQALDFETLGVLLLTQGHMLPALVRLFIEQDCPVQLQLPQTTLHVTHRYPTCVKLLEEM
jgi:hypothetical protein